MRVGIYVDGYSLYYGGRDLVGGSGEHWKWLDVRALMESVVGAQRGWPDAEITTIVYCTARIDARITRTQDRRRSGGLERLRPEVPGAAGP